MGFRNGNYMAPSHSTIMYWLRRLLLGIPSAQQLELIDGRLTPLPAAPQVSHYFERHGKYGVKTSVPAPASMAPILDYQSGFPTTLTEASIVCLTSSRASIVAVLNLLLQGSAVTSTNHIFHPSTGEWVGSLEAEKRSEELDNSDESDSVPELV
jgi:hypothetical protein